ncbi:hypothetical protein BGZ95_001158 [Linnemannia exigua]|uniref:Mid2 domain-containing protein n=1 Tax=Linnemannia exigua TaxID=604196 RepID=A0AAD4DJ92_9FUNG|nr:hypothetical protein BGZ95_001158 [Linnemannia exigua]
MANRVHTSRAPARTLASLLLAALCLGLISSSSHASPLPSITARAIQAAGARRALPWLEKRAPPAVILGPSPGGQPSEGGGGAGSTTTTPDPPVQTTTTTPPPVITTTTTDPAPITTTTTTKATIPTTTSEVPVTTTTTTTTSPTTTSSDDPGTTTTTTRSRSQQPRPSPDRPIGTGSKGPSVVTSANSTPTPTTTPVNPDDSSKPSILPIVLGSVLGAGVLIGAAVFFFLRFKKHRRFDSKRPLSFLALSADDHSTGTESASARALGTDALYDSNRPITSQPSLRYTPPVMSGINRYSYQSSEHSGATGGQFAQWSQDDENAALVGGPSRQQQLLMTEQGEDGYPARFHDGGVYSHEHVPIGDSEQPFVASSMMPFARNEPRHARYSQQQSQLQPETLEVRNVSNPPEASPALSHRGVPLQVLKPETEKGTPTSRPLSIHSNAASVLSIRNPSVRSEGQSAGGEQVGQSSQQGGARATEEDNLDFL